MRVVSSVPFVLSVPSILRAHARAAHRPDEQFSSYRTSTYKFHLYTTPTNLSFIMLSDPLADSLRGVLRQVYAGIFVPGVVRNPLVEWEREEEGERDGVDSDAVSGERGTQRAR